MGLFHTGQFLVEPLKREGQKGVIDAQLVQNRRDQVADTGPRRLQIVSISVEESGSKNRGSR
jgi:hypothetical protein